LRFEINNKLIDHQSANFEHPSGHDILPGERMEQPA